MMHRLSTTMAVMDCEISEIRLLLERYAGVLLEKPAEVLSGLIAQHLESLHMASSAELLAALRATPAECDALLERLLPGDTAFFRWPGAFQGFQEDALPDIAKRKTGDGRRSLRIWSAGCSTGEEAYSIAMSVCEALNGSGAGWSIHIVASDIRADALQTAERGLYEQHKLERVPRHLIPMYFSRMGGDYFLVKPRLRNLVTFTPMNLAQAGFIGRFDCIFCMDVLPHFSLAQRSALLQRLHLYLEPGGYLFVADPEKLPAADVSFTPDAHLTCTYYQRPFAVTARAGR